MIQNSTEKEIDRSKFALSEPGWYRPWETNVTSFSHHFHWQKVGCSESVIIFINYITWHSQLGNLNAILQVQTIEQVWLHLICWLHNTQKILDKKSGKCIEIFIFYFILSPFTSKYLSCKELPQMFCKQ